MFGGPLHCLLMVWVCTHQWWWDLITIGMHVIVSCHMTTLGGGYSPMGHKTEYDDKRRISCCSVFGCHVAVHNMAPDSGVKG